MFPEMSISSQKQKEQHFRHMGISSRVLMKSYSILIKNLLPKTISRSLEIGFIELFARVPELQELTERLTALKNNQARLTIDESK
jgi:hypothetical protein